MLSYGRSIMPNNKLEDYPVVKCVAGERIICVQRQHPVIFFEQTIVLTISLLAVPIFLLIISNTLVAQSFPILKDPIFIVCTILFAISVYLVFEIYIFLNWYFHFYVITNKALTERFSFRIAGPYSEVVFGEKLHIQEIIRKPLNIVYDFLKIQDVYVYFHKQEKEEPFIFKSPQNSQQIEDELEKLIAQSRESESKNIYQNGNN